MSVRLTICLMLFCLCATDGLAQDGGRRGHRRGWSGDGFQQRGDRGERGGRRRGRGFRGGGEEGRPEGGERGRGRRGFDPVARLDANGNGVIEQEEIDRIPAGIRERMEERGFQISAGESADTLRGRVEERMEQRRREWEERREEEWKEDQGSANRSTPPPPFRPRERVRMTVDLPADYQDLDTDVDGQVGLYEWLVSRRDDLEQFDDIDRNSDGFLTPRELVAWDRKQSASDEDASPQRTRLLIVGQEPVLVSAPSAPARGRARTGEQSGQTERERDPRNDASWIFERMDRDQDGEISLEEWERSRRVRPQLEAAGIESRPMSQKQFAKAWKKAQKRRSEGSFR